MPISFEPGEQNPFYLAIDKNKPIESRPTFYFRALAMREALKLNRDFAEYLRSDEPPEETQSKVVELLSRFVVGWDNIVIDGIEARYEPDLFPDVVTFAEANELIRGAINYTRPSVEEKKS